ncbi:GGDEF domain-containing protein [Qipengyuania sp. CAU 1752]
MTVLGTSLEHSELQDALAEAIVGRHGFATWPDALKRAYLTQSRRATARELRYFLIVTLAIAVITMLLDAIALPDQMIRGMFLRVALVLMPGLILIANAYRIKIRALKLGVSCTIIAFGTIVVHLASYADAATATRYTMSSSLLLGMALLLLPLLRNEKLGFAIGFCAAIFVTGLWPHALPGMVMLQHVLISLLVCSAALAIAFRHTTENERAFLFDIRDRFTQTELEQNIRVLRELSERDALTGLSNRRSFSKLFARSYQRANIGEQEEVTVMMIDLDHFKRFNDQYGHQAGDRALRAVGQCLESAFRDIGGLVARFGGEEFIAAFRSRSVTEAEQVAEMVRRAIERLDIPIRDCTRQRISTSIGIASTGSQASVDLSDLTARADRALYQAKREGRNRVVASERIELRVDRLAS